MSKNIIYARGQHHMQVVKMQKYLVDFFNVKDIVQLEPVSYMGSAKYVKHEICDLSALPCLKCAQMKFLI